MTCARCHRWLHRTPVYLDGMTFGPKCAAALAGAKPRHGRITTALRAADARQRDLFTEAAT
ncbi:hypothetical protein GmRootV59_12880 [Variovorax sp. V59]|uniref:hypothetical protein n=1 Tax=unclassified Variovorax TaxID=663243 RepID=UPI0034E86275